MKWSGVLHCTLSPHALFFMMMMMMIPKVGSIANALQYYALKLSWSYHGQYIGTFQTENPYFRYIQMMWCDIPGKPIMLRTCWSTRPLKMKNSGHFPAAIARNLSKLSFISLGMKKFTPTKSLSNVSNVDHPSGIVIKLKSIKSPAIVWDLFHVIFAT